MADLVHGIDTYTIKTDMVQVPMQIQDIIRISVQIISIEVIRVFVQIVEKLQLSMKI